MPDLAEVASLLRQALHRLDGADTSLAAAHAGARTIGARTTVVGLLGIAAGMRELEQLLDRVQQLLRGMAADVSGASTATAKVAAETCLTDVISTLSTALRQLDAASGRSGAISRELGLATAQANRSLTGGAPEAMLGLLDEIDRAVRDAVETLADATARTEELATAAKTLGSADANSGSALSAPGGNEPPMSERLGRYTTNDLRRVTDHLARPELDPFSANDVMLERIERAISSGRPLTDRQVYFLRHELLEVDLMDGGMEYPAAHAKALKTHPPGHNYDVDVIDRFEEFGLWWRKMNGLDPR